MTSLGSAGTMVRGGKSVPRCVWAVFMTMGLLVGQTTTARPQDQAYPKLIDNNAQPIYPAAARAGAIEGEVEYRAAVRNDGTVESITILRVPQPNVGFERAVEDAVKKWRFQPTWAGNIVTTAMYSGTIRFQLSIPREWIYAMSSRTTWTRLRDLARELKLGVERLDDKHQVLVTDWQQYRGRSFPEQGSLGLPLGQCPERIQFHVQVAPGMEPARVAIGSIIQTRHMADGRRDGFTVYAREAPSAWLLAKLTERTGTRPEPLSASADRRAEQTRLLMPTDLA